MRVLAVQGELDLNTAPEFEAPLEEALAGEDKMVLVDLSQCEFIDSTGIALLVHAWQRLDRSGGEGNGRFVVCSHNHQVRRLLEITGIESSISLHDQRDAALAELRG